MVDVNGHAVLDDIGALHQFGAHSGYVCMLQTYVVEPLHQFLYHACPDATCQVVEQEALAAHHLLYDASEHPHGKHVEENMLEITVHEHVGQQLIGHEIVCQEEVQS